MEQQTQEWFNARVGRVTASRIKDVVARTKTGYGASRANYMAELVAERLTGQPADRFQNAAMAWGTQMEPEARRAYSFRADVDVAEVGFIEHPEIDMTGASPDGLVGFDGLVEIKCPNTATHLDTLLSATVPGDYLTQMQWQMACTGRKWCDFASYDPRLPAGMALFIARVHRDEARIAELEVEVKAFLAELADKVERLRATYDIAAAA